MMKLAEQMPHLAKLNQRHEWLTRIQTDLVYWSWSSSPKPNATEGSLLQGESFSVHKVLNTIISNVCTEARSFFFKRTGRRAARYIKKVALYKAEHRSRKKRLENRPSNKEKRNHRSKKLNLRNKVLVLCQNQHCLASRKKLAFFYFPHLARRESQKVS